MDVFGECVYFQGNFVGNGQLVSIVEVNKEREACPAFNNGSYLGEGSVQDVDRLPNVALDGRWSRVRAGDE